MLKHADYAVAGSTPQWDMKKPVERPTLFPFSGFATFFQVS
jgi:hypothetical protein